MRPSGIDPAGALWHLYARRTMSRSAPDPEAGQTISEYALILAGIGLIAALALLFLASKTNILFHKAGSGVQTQPLRPPVVQCDPSYSGACIPPPPPDLDCSDLRAMGITGEVRVVGSDPHHLDPDGDGIACD